MTILQTGLAQAAGVTGYQIARSLRFNSADSAYLNRTPGTAGNRKTWTWSGWVKRTSLGTAQSIFGSSISGSATQIFFDSSDRLWLYGSISASVVLSLVSTSVYRDISSWYHIVVMLDTTQATSSNRAKIWVNGVQLTAFSTSTYPTQNTDMLVNSTNAHNIGRDPFSAANLCNFYLTETYLIDGTSVDPSSFGETDATTGIWSPKAYTGTYGTNGFYLNFSDNSGTTATTLGKDSSGNGNNWTPNNFSITAGVGNDSLVDSPTNYGTDTGVGGEVRGNYCTMNPLGTVPAGANNMPNFLNGNLDITGKGTAATWYDGAQSTFIFTAGKYYWETTINAIGGGVDLALIAQNSYTVAGRIYRNGGNKVINGTSTAYGASFTTGDVIGFAADFDGGTLTCYKNGTSQGVLCSDLASALPAAGWSINPQTAVSGSVSLNFGQRPFAYTAPSGFKALCTTNLSTPAIVKPNTNFDVALYTGTGSSLSVSSLGFQPDFTWIKGRSGATNHALYDAVRGVQKDLVSNSTSAETTETQGLTAFGSTGFTVGTLAKLNTNAATYAAWNWKANGAGSSNTSGTITSTVSANTTAGISVVTYTGTGTAGATVGHGLGVAPKFIIVKERSAVAGWGVYHASIGALDYLALNTTAAKVTNTMWNDTSPTSTVFSLGGSGFGVNDSTVTAVAYCFAEIAGFSKFGSYTGNGSADGRFVYLGFRPRFIMLKRTDTTGDWNLIDTSRNPYNAVDLYIYANTSAAEGTYSGYDILSNGFKLRNTGANINASGGTYIFAAFAEAPFNYARAR